MFTERSSRLVWRAFQRGLLGGHRGWQVALFFLLVLRFLQKFGRPGSGPVRHREVLDPGEGISILNLKKSSSLEIEDVK